MTTDITLKIADMLRLANPDLDARIGYQSEALRENKCISPSIGNWIDANDVKYLLSALMLNDNDFEELFPEISGVNKEQRRMLVETIEGHFDTCLHCSLKRGYDYEHDSQIKKICLQNKDTLLQMLDEEEAAEGEHQPETEETGADFSKENQKVLAQGR